jgi:methenyltetrahydrofolate cyclohydrolase
MTAVSTLGGAQAHAHDSDRVDEVPQRRGYLPDMTEDVREPHADTANAVRRALIDAALGAYEDAGLSGLCAEGRWEAAVDAMRSLDVSRVATPATDLTADLSRVIATVATASSPPPSGGSVAASAGALAAALTQMVAGLTAGRPRYADVAAEMQQAAQRASALAAELLALVARDAAAVDAVGAAYRLPKVTQDDAAARAGAIERTMLAATEAPLEIARAAARVAELAATVAERGNRNAVADAAVAVLLAESVCRAAALTVGVNVGALHDMQAGRRLEREAAGAADAAGRAVARTVSVVEHASGRRAGTSR